MRLSIVMTWNRRMGDRFLSGFLSESIIERYTLTIFTSMQLQHLRAASPLGSKRKPHRQEEPKFRGGISSYGSLSLAEYPTAMERLKCSKCGRSGQCRKATLIDRCGGDIVLPELLRRIAADCPKVDALGSDCPPPAPVRQIWGIE
jgi:hypothetical protein